MTLFLQAISNGLLVGGVYCLIGVGMTLIFGVMKIINAAHGDLMMIAMYVSFFLFVGIKLDPFLSLVVAVPALFAFGCVLHWGLLSKLRSAKPENSLILTWGVSLIVVNLFTLVFTGNYRSVTPGYATKTFHLGGVSVGVASFFGLLVAIALTTALYLFLLKSDFGLAVRALSQNEAGARVVGISVSRVQTLCFGLGAALAGAAGAVFSASSYMFPAIGGQFTVKAFEVIVLGGLGKVAGAFWAALLLGCAEALGGQYISLELKDAIGFLVFLAVLIVKPDGLFGRSRV